MGKMPRKCRIASGVPKFYFGRVKNSGKALFAALRLIGLAGAAVLALLAVARLRAARLVRAESSHGGERDRVAPSVRKQAHAVPVTGRRSLSVCERSSRPADRCVAPAAIGSSCAESCG